MRNDTVGPVVPLPGATAVSPIGGQSFWATTGAGGDPTMNTGQAVYKTEGTNSTLVADLYAFEATYNPDGNDPFDSNPYDVAALDADHALVVDAGGNDLLRVSSNGDVDVLAVFPRRTGVNGKHQGARRMSRLRSRLLLPFPMPFRDRRSRQVSQ